MSRKPTIQTRLLASAPVFFGSWGFAAWSFYQLSQRDEAWPLLLLSSVAVATVMKADAQVKAWKDWQREWNAMSGVAPRPRIPPLQLAVSLILFLLLCSLLSYAHQHGGGQAVVGVFLVLGAPILAIAGLVRLWRMARRGDAKRAALGQPVRIAVRRPLRRVPSLSAAYQALPPYCQQLLKGQR